MLPTVQRKSRASWPKLLDLKRKLKSFCKSWSKKVYNEAPTFIIIFEVEYEDQRHLTHGPKNEFINLF